MNRLQELYQLTKQLEKVFDQKITSKNREMMIEEINKLIEQRSYYLEKVIPPYTEEEKALGKEIVHLNTKIEQEMKVIFDDLKKEMQQIKKQKKSNESYVNPFKNVRTMDGMFMDRKN